MSSQHQSEALNHLNEVSEPIKPRREHSQPRKYSPSDSPNDKVGKTPQHAIEESSVGINEMMGKPTSGAKKSMRKGSGLVNRKGVPHKYQPYKIITDEEFLLNQTPSK